MARELWLIRHGQAAFASDDYDRLTELGWQQARWLGEHLVSLGVSFDRVAAGELRRQQETAQVLGEALGPPVETIPGFEEYDAGSLMRAAGLIDRDPSVTSRAEHFRRLRGVLLDWAAGRIEGRESWDGFRARVMAAVGEATGGADGRVAVASSGGAIAMAVTTILGLPPEQMIAFNLQARNTGVTRLIFARGHVYLNQFNAVPHLEHPDRRHAETYS